MQLLCFHLEFPLTEWKRSIHTTSVIHQRDKGHNEKRQRVVVDSCDSEYIT